MRDQVLNSRALTRLIWAVCAAGIVTSGCTSGTPAAPDTIVGDLYISGTCFVFPEGPPPGLGAGTSVVIREGGEAGSDVLGLDVSVNGVALSFDQTAGAYVGPAPSAAPGEEVVICVADAGAALVRFVRVPSAPYGLDLLAGHWHISSADDVNTLAWLNPTARGAAITATVYDYDQSSGAATQVYSRVIDEDAIVLSIRNDALTYYSTMTSVTGVVCQTNTVGFPNNPDTSEFTVACGIWGNWPARQRLTPTRSGTDDPF
jgi:hypothetical protein